MDVLSETRWALNNEIIKQVASSWSLFIQLIEGSMLNNAEQKFLLRKNFTWLITSTNEDKNIAIAPLILKQDPEAVFIYKTMDFLSTKKSRTFVFSTHLHFCLKKELVVLVFLTSYIFVSPSLWQRLRLHATGTILLLCSDSLFFCKIRTSASFISLRQKLKDCSRIKSTLCSSENACAYNHS